MQSLGKQVRLDLLRYSAFFLKAVLPTIVHPLYNIFNSSLRMGYYPTPFRNSVTIALRKPGKDDYSQPKSYRPIALLNTIGKAIEYIIAKRIQALAEKYIMLPEIYIRGRKLISTEYETALLSLA